MERAAVARARMLVRDVLDEPTALLLRVRLARGSRVPYPRAAQNNGPCFRDGSDRSGPRLSEVTHGTQRTIADAVERVTDEVAAERRMRCSSVYRWARLRYGMLIARNAESAKPAGGAVDRVLLEDRRCVVRGGARRRDRLLMGVSAIVGGQNACIGLGTFDDSVGRGLDHREHANQPSPNADSTPPMRLANCTVASLEQSGGARSVPEAAALRRGLNTVATGAAGTLAKTSEATAANFRKRHCSLPKRSAPL